MTTETARAEGSDGRVYRVNISPGGVPKLPVAEARVRRLGLEGDAHDHFRVHGGTFVVLLIGTVLLVGALNFLPVLALGPIVEHFLTFQGKLF